jgi:hypothetical protein
MPWARDERFWRMSAGELPSDEMPAVCVANSDELARAPLRKAERRDRIGARRGRVTPGDIIPEWWARSSRNGGRHQIGTVGEIIPEWWATSSGISEASNGSRVTEVTPCSARDRFEAGLNEAACCWLSPMGVEGRRRARRKAAHKQMVCRARPIGNGGAPGR